MTEFNKFRLFSYAAYFIFGAFMVGFSAAMPSIRTELSLSYEVTGFIFSLGSWGFLVGAGMMGLLVDLFGVFRPLVAGLVIMSVGAITLTAAANAWAVGVAHFVMMVGASMLEAGIPIMAGKFQRGLGKLLNLIHSFFALGAIVGPLVIAGFLGFGFSWRVFFGLFVSISVGCICILFSLRAFEIVQKTPVAGKEKEKRFDFFKSLTFWLLTLGIGFYVASEIGASSWMAIFSSDHLGETPEKSSLLPSLFWLGLFAGRVGFASMVDRLGAGRWLTLISLVGLPIVFFSLNPSGGWAGLAVLVVVSGLIHSTIYPTMQSLIVQNIHKGVGYALGVFAAFGSIASSLASLVIGMISGTSGVNTGYSMIFIFYVGTMAVIIALYLRLRRKVTG